MHKGYKFRIYPNEEQRILFDKTFGCVRFIYNQMLSDKITHYKLTGEMLYCYPSQYKAEYPWLKEVDSLALVGAYNALDSAYRNFFNGKSVGFPKFKSKKNSQNTYTTNCVNRNIRIEGKHIVLPKAGKVRITQHRSIPFGYKLKSVTVSQSPSGKYYAAILFEYPGFPKNYSVVSMEASKHESISCCFLVISE